MRLSLRSVIMPRSLCLSAGDGLADGRDGLVTRCAGAADLHVEEGALVVAIGESCDRDGADEEEHDLQGLRQRQVNADMNEGGMEHIHPEGELLAAGRDEL